MKKEKAITLIALVITVIIEINYVSRKLQCTR